MKKMLFILSLAVFAASCSTEATTETEKLYDTTETAQVFAENYEAQTEMQADILEMINQYRYGKNREELQINQVAYKYAAQHNEYQIEEGRTSHDGFETRAQQVSNQTGAVKVGENVGLATSDEVNGMFRAFKNSAPHNATMLGDYTHIGISVKQDERGAFFYSLLFIKK